MPFIISDYCINCGACEIECPQNAVHPGIKTLLINKPAFIRNTLLYNGFINQDHYYINPGECNNCEGYYLSARCNEVCPVSCCLSEDEYFSEWSETVKSGNDPVLTAVISLN